MSKEEGKIYEIRNEDMHYYGEDKNLQRISTENSLTVVERLQPST